MSETKKEVGILRLFVQSLEKRSVVKTKAIDIHVLLYNKWLNETTEVASPERSQRL